MAKVAIGRAKDFIVVIGYLDQFTVPTVGSNPNFKENIYIKIIAIQKLGIENPTWENILNILYIFLSCFLANKLPKGIETSKTIINVPTIIVSVVGILDFINSSTV